SEIPLRNGPDVAARRRPGIALLNKGSSGYSQARGNTYISRTSPQHAAGRFEVLASNDQQIFLIDEDDIVRDSLKVLLESHGKQVRDYRSAAEFLAESGSARLGCLVLGYN